MGVPGPPQPCWAPFPALLQSWRGFPLRRDFFLLTASLDSQGMVCLQQRDAETPAERVVLIA